MSKTGLPAFSPGSTSGGSSSSAGLFPQAVSGEWFGTPYGSANTISNFTMNANQVWYSPFVITSTRTLNAIAAYVDTLVPSCVIRLGIYASDANNRPGTLVLDAGTVNGNGSTGVVSTTINQALTPGLYWFAAVSQGASGKVRATAVLGLSSITTVPNDLSAPNVAFTSLGVGGALPATPTLSYTNGGSNAAPLVFGKVA